MDGFGCHSSRRRRCHLPFVDSHRFHSVPPGAPGASAQSGEALRLDWRETKGTSVDTPGGPGVVKKPGEEA